VVGTSDARKCDKAEFLRGAFEVCVFVLSVSPVMAEVDVVAFLATTLLDEVFFAFGATRADDMSEKNWI
jgi:hypothetical protein